MLQFSVRQTQRYSAYRFCPNKMTTAADMRKPNMALVPTYIGHISLFYVARFADQQAVRFTERKFHGFIVTTHERGHHEQ